MSEAVEDIWQHQQWQLPSAARHVVFYSFIAGAQKLVVAGSENMDLIIIAVQIILGTYFYLNTCVCTGT